MINLEGTLTQVRQAIQAAAEKSGRSSNEITLLAVSKKQPADQIRLAYQAGQRSFAENYLQEGETKRQALADLAITWHFIGSVQSNKAKILAEHWHWVHTVDRRKILQILHQHRPINDKPLNICLQVNINQDSAKSGCTAEEAFGLAQQAQALPKLALRGLMTIPTQGQSVQAFSQLQNLFDDINRRLSTPMDTLSMGMSADYIDALNYGATIVRIGTALFGQRPN